jgi:dTDP-4-amino-4,6-dideoxygalactose transaminase
MAKEKPIFISLSPNAEKDDVILALKLLFQPWIWKKESTFLEEEFKNYFKVKYAFSFNSGRSALMAILNALNLKEEDEVLIQAFTCNALVNPIIWLKLKPVFVDCERETLNLDIEDLKRKISPKSKVLIIQHTFGLPSNLKEILEICKEKNLILIEDCAHSLGASFQGRKIGTFSKAAFFSFGRDKIISSVFGGMAITDDEIIGKRIEKFWEKLETPSYFWILQQILYPILIELIIKPLFDFFGIGRRLLFLFQKMKILSKAVSKKEKEGEKPEHFPQKMPFALSLLAQNQFKKLERFNQHREKIAEIYEKELKGLNVVLPKKKEGRVWMRYSLIFDFETEFLLKKLSRNKIFLDDGWRKTPVVPPDNNLEKMKYISGSCPQAEKVAKSILNLPTSINITIEDAKKIINFLKNTI